MTPRRLLAGALAGVGIASVLVAALAARQVVFQDRYAGWRFTDTRRVQLWEALVEAGVFSASGRHAVVETGALKRLVARSRGCWDGVTPGTCGLDQSLAQLLRGEGFVRTAKGSGPVLDVARLLAEMSRNLDNLEVDADRSLRVAADRFGRGLPSSTGGVPARILDRDGAALAFSEEGFRTTRRKYTHGSATLPLLGLSSFGASGIDRIARPHLVGGPSVVARLLPSRYFPPQGTDLQLTLSSSLQRAAYDSLGRAGAAIVLDARTGAILAAASAPSAQPAGITSARYQALERDDNEPLLNRAWDQLYPPGSTFKLVVLSAAYRDPEGRVRSLHVDCDGQDHEGIRCPRPHGRVDIGSALAVSCNLFFAEAAGLLGPLMRDEARRLGFGEQPEVLLPASVTTRPYRAAMSQAYDVVANDGTATRRFDFSKAPARELGMCGLGQNCVTATPLQIASLTQTIANSGRRVPPSLSPAAEAQGLKAMDPIVATEIRAQMEEAWKDGTARSLPRIHVDRGHYTVGGTAGTEVRVAAKTGTAEVVWEEGGRLWRKPPHSWFTAFAPADKPRVVVTVLIEHGGAGAAVAGPRAVRLLAEALNATAERVR